MEAIKTHVAGVDVHKEILAITVLIGEEKEEPKITQFECSTFTDDLIACGIKLKDMGVTNVAMESTGIYWKSPYNVWSPMGIKVTVGQASQIRNVPGRKTDMNDSHWMAQIHRFGLIRPSFIPDSEFQQMRMFSRQRTNLVEDSARVKNRIQKVLESGNMKLGSIVANVFGVSGRQVLESIAKGEVLPSVLVEQITTKIKKKEDAKKALTNCLSQDHCLMIKLLMEQLLHLEEQIEEVDNILFERIKPYRHLIDKLNEIPGINLISAIGILAETSNNVKNFDDERKFAAWAGVAASNNESAGKKKEQNVGKEILT